ncbi:MAG: hypothetical protein AAGU21_13390 [Solidesulfovibrio sp.]|jgi:hypothetical protein|uniref:hypothetical protein n=1 Tax=Solidesulfovibrio sp. TaxID=2910990 RepID=UPI002B1FA835|nr:hypothetical protein [Solidesulfovibrio sp.]MEA4857467.1 hypothetical protein [Solidesulfovibrio sp.]
MAPEQAFLPVWMSFLVGLVLFFTRKWMADVARAIESLEDRLRALEKAQADCRLELAKGYPTRPELERLAERLENHATRLTILEERDLAA